MLPMLEEISQIHFCHVNYKLPSGLVLWQFSSFGYITKMLCVILSYEIVRVRSIVFENKYFLKFYKYYNIYLSHRIIDSFPRISADKTGF